MLGNAGVSQQIAGETSPTLPFGQCLNRSKTCERPQGRLSTMHVGGDSWFGLHVNLLRTTVSER